MPNSKTYARLEKDCEHELKRLIKSGTHLDDPIDSAALPKRTGVRQKADQGMENGMTELSGAKKGIEAMAKECKARFDVCVQYEKDLKAYGQACAAHTAACSNYTAQLQAYQNAKADTKPGSTITVSEPSPPPALGPAPVPPAYWSKD